MRPSFLYSYSAQLHTRFPCLILNASAQTFTAQHGAAAANTQHATAAADSAGIEFFETKVRPALAKYCFECHSQKASKAMGGLTLDSRKAMMTGGKQGPALAAFAPDSSRLVEAVRYKNPDMQMPPSGKIPDSVIEDIAAWVRMGAPWPGGTVIDFNRGSH